MSPVTFINDSRKVGVKKAWASFRKRRHLLPLAGYLILASATGWSFHTADQARDKIATQTRVVQLAGCERTNDLRKSLVAIIENSNNVSQNAAKKGILPPEQAERSQRFTDEAVREIGPIDCEKAYPKLKD